MRWSGPLPALPALPAALLLALCAASLAAVQATAASEAGELGSASFAAAFRTAGERALLSVAPQPDPPYVLENLPLQLVKLPPGFSISLYANASIPARFFAVGNRGRAKPTIVYVSSNSGSVSS